MLVDFPEGTGPNSTGYDVTLVTTSGCAVKTAHAATRSYIHGAGSISTPSAADLPEVSVANGGVYFLDGDSEIRFMTPTLDPKTVASILGGANAHAGFSVSPDGSRVAVSVLTYQGDSAALDLYVSDLSGTNRIDLFHSTSEAAWPVAWHGGDVVLAVGPLFSQQGLWDNPYFAASFHVVNATTATRVAAIGGPDYQTGCEVSALLVPAGTACYHRTATSGMGGEFWILDWNGSRLQPGFGSANGGTAAVNPDQAQTLALLDQSVPALEILSPGNKVSADLSGPVDSWPCWIDDGHVLIGSVNSPKSTPVVVDASTGQTTSVQAHGFCAAVLGGSAELR